MNIFYTNLNKPNSDSDCTDSFKYFYRDINEKISFNLQEPLYNMNLELYYKLNNRIIKFVKKIDFNILLKTKNPIIF